MGVLVFVALAQPATAAEPVSPFSWTGIYLGGHMGGQWFSSGHTHEYSSPIGGTVSSGAASFDDGRFFGGAQVGFNWQVTRNLVFGIEADVSWADHNVGGVVTQNPLVATEHYDGTSILREQGSVRGRLGYTASPWLLYVTGGAAFGRAEVATSIIDNAVGSVTFSESRTLTGWTVGGGFDYFIFPNWLLGIEYRYTDLGSLSVTTPTVNFPTDVQSYVATGDFRTHDVRVRVSYMLDVLGAMNR